MDFSSIISSYLYADIFITFTHNIVIKRLNVMRLKNKTAIVTGGGSGIGRGIAMRFAREGADVVVADVDKGGADEVKEGIEEIGREAFSIETDVSDADSVDKLADRTIDKFGKIDILVNNAGVFVQKPIRNMEEEDWDKVLDVNLKGTFLCTRKVVDEMRQLPPPKSRI